MLQTTAGKMIFGRYEEPRPERPPVDRERNHAAPEPHPSRENAADAQPSRSRVPAAPESGN